MDKLDIVGGYEFLGFCLGSSFLEKGYRVNCIHVDKPFDLIYEEKRFTVGRNANFQEIDLKSWLSIENQKDGDPRDSLIVVSLYDVSCNSTDDTRSKKVEQDIFHALLNLDLTDSQILFLLPIYYLDRGAEIGEYIFVCEELKRRRNIIKQVYLPTLYGPWQPNEYLFQQAILQGVERDRKFKVNKHEYFHDAIYITDAIRGIEQVIKDKSKLSYILISEVSDHWKKCAQLLQINPEVYNDSNPQASSSDSLETIVVKESIGYEKGLEKQKEYVSRLLAGFL